MPSSTQTARILRPAGQIVCEDCELAVTFARRLRGLMGRRALASGTGLLIRPGASVHTCFMRFPIDVVFLDREHRVLRVAEAVRPWRLVGARGARAVVELPAGEAARRALRAGETLRIEGSA
jgi:uncharacterized protein